MTKKNTNRSLTHSMNYWDIAKTEKLKQMNGRHGSNHYNNYFGMFPSETGLVKITPRFSLQKIISSPYILFKIFFLIIF